jgi:hypothetical protein
MLSLKNIFEILIIFNICIVQNCFQLKRSCLMQSININWPLLIGGAFVLALIVAGLISLVLRWVLVESVDGAVKRLEHDAEAAYKNAEWLIKSGAHMVKFEGGGDKAKTAHYLVERGIPVCAHLGFTPQTVNQIGGYKIQGKTEESAKQILIDAKAMSDAGASFVLLEMVPAALAKAITESIKTPTIGIGAGVDCSGQVLVLQD